MNYYNEIKNELINNEINRKVKNYSINRSDLNTYYNVGKILSEAGKHYGENIIGDYANKLKLELNKKYNERTLRRYRQFYNFVTNLKWSAMPTKLSWSHITELMVLSDEDEINYYVSIVNERNVSYRKLSELIKDNEYSRIDENTKNKLRQQEKLGVIDFVKNPIRIKNNQNYEVFSEKALQKLILEDIEYFMKELGSSFCFIGSEYKIRLDNTFNYIDLLLFNYEYNCFVVIELKVTPYRKLKSGKLSAKERLVLNIIDFENEYKNEFRSSHFWYKNNKIQLLWYLWEPGKDKKRL